MSIPRVDHETTEAQAQALAEQEQRIRSLELRNGLQQEIIMECTVAHIEQIALRALDERLPVTTGGLLLLDTPIELDDIIAGHLRPMNTAPAEVGSAGKISGGSAQDWPGLAAMQAGQLWLVNDLAAQPPFAGQQALLANGIQAVMDVPLRVDGSLIGALCLASCHANSFQPSHVQTALQVAEAIRVGLSQARLMDVERKRRHEYEMIHTLTQVMRGALTQNELYAIFLPEALRLLDAQCGAVFVPRDGGVLESVLVEGDTRLAGCSLEHHDLPAAIWRAADQREIVLVSELNCSLLPLQSGGQLFSVMALCWEKPISASASPTNLLLTISDLLSIALTRLSARETLEQKVNQRTRELMALYEIARLYVSSDDIQTIAENSLSVVLHTLHARAGLIHLINTQGPSLNVVAHLGLDPSLLSEALDFGSDNSEWRRFIQSGSPLLIRNLPGRDDLPRAIARSGFQSFLASPIRADQTTLGAISLFYQAEDVLSVEDMNLVDLIADQLGIVIERSQLRQKANAAAILEERHRLARELHDSVSQSLYSLSFMADALRSLAEQQQWARMQTQLTFMQESAQQALKEMRLLVYELVPASLEEQGLATVIRQRLTYVEKRVGMQTDLVIEGELDLPVEMQLGVYRIAQEALNNVIKHAHARCVKVSLCNRPPLLRLQVQDDGVGINMESAAPGMGLRNMRERAAQLGGRLEVETRPGAGTKVTFMVNEECE